MNEITTKLRNTAAPAALARAVPSPSANLPGTNLPATKLPAELAMYRMLNNAEAAMLAGYHPVHWRRLYLTGLAPAPRLIGRNRVGWPADELIAWLKARPKRQVAGGA